MKRWLSHFLKEHHTNLKAELIAGLTTFSTMAYIIFLNPQILHQAGIDAGAAMVATIIASSLACFLMGVFANYPFAVAPGMGLNAYFTYGLVLNEGHPWQIALGISFIAGAIFLLLNIFNLRAYIMHSIPEAIRKGTIAGVGFFLALIGMKNSHLIISHPSTLVALGNLSQPEVYLTLLGVIIIGVLMAWRFKAAILIGIILNCLIGYALGLIPIKEIVDPPPSLAPTFLQLDIWGALKPELLPALLSFILVALFDSAGTLLGLAGQGGFLDTRGFLPRAKNVLYIDAIGTSLGALLGTSPLTTYLESSAGIASGGRTGLTVIVVALLFLSCLFFSPLATSIPFFATSPALIVIGTLMLSEIRHIKWEDLTEMLPALFIVMTIPLSYSIATGIAMGFMLYPLLKLFTGRSLELHWITWLFAALFGLKFFYS